MDAPAKKVVTGNQPLPIEEKAKSPEQKNAEKKLEEFKDKAVLDKPASDPSASYYITRTEQGKKLMLAAYGHKDTRISRLVDESLNWLHRHQEKEGYWDFDGYIKNCPHGSPDDVSKIKGEHDVAITGLALLAFLGAGHTHIPGQKVETSTASQPDLPPGGQYKPTVERGLKWLVSIQMGDGSFKNPVTGDAGNKVSMFDQAMATLAISEAYGMTGDEALKGPAQKAINFISNAKSPGKGWRYTPCSGDSDTSLVGWQVFALKSGKVSGLDVDRADFELASAWLDSMTNLDNGRVGYHEKGAGSPAITSIGIICRMLLGWRNDSPLLKKGADFVIADKSWQKGPPNFYHIYQTALAMFQMGGNYWEVWNKEMTDNLASTISKEGCEKGSWPAGDDKYCQSRVYTTALGALSLEVYWRYLPFAR
ncbi:MAG: prenyltransferase/squalene oxidase repeat-containing protein [Planctomycetota bacterium]